MHNLINRSSECIPGSTGFSRSSLTWVATPPVAQGRPNRSSARIDSEANRWATGFPWACRLDSRTAEGPSAVADKGEGSCGPFAEIWEREWANCQQKRTGGGGVGSTADWTAVRALLADDSLQPRDERCQRWTRAKTRDWVCRHNCWIRGRITPPWVASLTVALGWATEPLPIRCSHCVAAQVEDPRWTGSRKMLAKAPAAADSNNPILRSSPSWHHLDYLQSIVVTIKRRRRRRKTVIQQISNLDSSLEIKYWNGLFWWGIARRRKSLQSDFMKYWLVLAILEIMQMTTVQLLREE